MENKVQNHFISGETLIGVPCLENDTLFGSLVQDLSEQQFVTSGRCGLLQGSTFWHTIQQIATSDRCGLLQRNNFWHTIQQIVASDIYGLLQGNNFWYIIQQFVTSDRCDLLQGKHLWYTIQQFVSTAGWWLVTMQQLLVHYSTIRYKCSFWPVTR